MKPENFGVPGGDSPGREFTEGREQVNRAGTRRFSGSFLKDLDLI